MNSDTYESDIAKFDKYRKAVDNLFDRKHPDELKKTMIAQLHYIGLTGEVGELGEKLKKAIRDKGGIHMRDPEIEKELGDVIWYFASICKDLSYTINEVMETNINKLQKRLDENKIHGNGDNR